MEYLDDMLKGMVCKCVNIGLNIIDREDDIKIDSIGGNEYVVMVSPDISFGYDGVSIDFSFSEFFSKKIELPLEYNVKLSDKKVLFYSVGDINFIEFDIYIDKKTFFNVLAKLEKIHPISKSK